MRIERCPRKKKNSDSEVEKSNKPASQSIHITGSHVPIATKADKPLGNLIGGEYKTSTSINVIKESFEQEKKAAEENKKEATPENLIPTEFISQEVATKLWASYIEKVKSSGKLSYLGTISHLVPKVKESGALVFEINNTVIEKEFIEAKPEIITYFRQQTEKTLVIETVVNEEVVLKKFMTDRDRFEKMAENNPALFQLRKALDLEFEH